MTSSNFPTMFNEGGASGIGYSEIEAYLRCPKEYQYAKIRGIGKPASQTPDYFAIGAFVHAGRARWFASSFGLGDDVWKQIREDIAKTRSGFPLPCSDESESIALRYLQEYVDHWSVREKPKIVAVEHFLGPTAISSADDGVIAMRTARLDDFGFYPEAGGKLMIGECKTTSAPISDVVNQYTLHGQPALQRLLWDRAPQGAATYGEASGMVLDVIQKGYGGKRCTFARLAVDISVETLAWARRTFVGALMDKAGLHWDSTPERRITSCTRLVGKARVACPYRDLCQFGRAGALGFTLEDGTPLTSWVPTAVQTVPPWE